MPRRTFGGIRAIGFHLLVDLLANVHHAGDLGTAREVVFVLNGFGLQPGGEVLGEIVCAAGHPAGGLGRLGHSVVIGILFVVRPGIPTYDGVDLNQANQENQAARYSERDNSHLTFFELATNQFPIDK